MVLTSYTLQDIPKNNLVQLPYPSNPLTSPHCRSAEANKYSQVELRLMKTQDIKYIALKAQTEAKVRIGNPPPPVFQAEFGGGCDKIGKLSRS